VTGAVLVFGEADGAAADAVPVGTSGAATLDGFQMIGKVREMEQHKRTPVFVLTTESGTNMVKQGKALGATAWIVKSSTPDALWKVVEKALLG